MVSSGIPAGLLRPLSLSQGLSFFLGGPQVRAHPLSYLRKDRRVQTTDGAVESGRERRGAFLEEVAAKVNSGERMGMSCTRPSLRRWRRYLPHVTHCLERMGSTLLSCCCLGPSPHAPHFTQHPFITSRSSGSCSSSPTRQGQGATGWTFMWKLREGLGLGMGGWVDDDGWMDGRWIDGWMNDGWVDG